MDSGLYSAASSMAANLQSQEVIARNLANVNTTGYKRQRPVYDSFATELFQQYNTETDPDPSLVNIPDVVTDFSPGNMNYTEDALSVAIDGKGFFVVQTAEGERYTRDGQFARAGDGSLVTLSGARVLGTGGPIQIPALASNLKIDAEGNVTAIDQSSQPHVPLALGTLRVVQFDDDVKLNPVGYSFFAPESEDAVPTDAANAKIRQGYLEQSNVNLVEEVVRMIATMRSLESAQRSLKSIDKSTEQLISTSQKTV